jgi:cobalt/nickel transport system permease protein
MRRGLTDPYEHRESVVHRAPAGVKLVAAVLFVAAVVTVPPSPRTLLPAAGLLLAATAAARIPPWPYLRRLLLLEPFALGVALLALAQPGGARIFATMLARSTLCLAAMVLLTTTTRFTDLLGVLWRARVPVLLVTTLALLHRYLFVLVDEMRRMDRARQSRTIVAVRRRRWWLSSTVVAHLFVRTSERAERVYAAMVARGWRT